MSVHALPRAARHALIAILLALAALTASALTAPARAAAADPVAITQGDGLRWGMKLSWRNYTGAGTWSDGVEYLGGADGYLWPFRSGSYDPDTHDAELRFGGSVRWTGHGGLLDVTISEPRLILHGDDARLVAKTVSRSESTGELVDYGEVALVSVALRDDALTTGDGRTSWSDLATNLTATGYKVFSGNYPVGTVMDPISTAYSGPGGMPTLPVDDFTPAGTVGFREVARSPVATPAQHFYDLFWDAGANVLHATTDAAWGSLAALDPGTLGMINNTARELTAGATFPAAAFDPATSTVFDVDGTTIHTFTWNAGGFSYETDEFPAGMFPYAIAWDAHGQRLLAASMDELASFRREQDGSWTRTSYTLTGDPYFAASRSQIAIDDDGAIVLAEVMEQPKELRLSGTTATVTALADDLSDPDPLDPMFAQPSEVRAIPGGGFYVSTYRGQVARVARAADGRLRKVGETVGLGYGAVLSSAIGPDGTFLAVDRSLQKIGIVRDGARRGELTIDAEPGAGVVSPVAVAFGADGALYLEQGGSDAGAQLVKYARGSSPTVEDPADAVVPLAAGVESGSATFTAAATADGDVPTVRWQTRAGASGRFTDVDGADEPTLHLPVTAADNGRQVRAVFSNAYGTLGTAPATVTVNTAAAVVVEPADVTVEPGQTAELKVMPSGNPAPEIQWQVLVGGTWTDIAEGAAGYEVDGGFLRVPNVSAAQDGTQFRARLRNRITPGSEEWSTVDSRVATLHVTGVPGGPVDPGPQPDQPGAPNQPGAPQPSARAKAAGTIAAGATTATIGAKRVARVARLRCAAAGRCTVTVAKRLTIKLGGTRSAATVSAPRALAAGRRGVVTLTLSRKAAARLAGRRVTVKLRVTVRASGARAVTKVVTVTLKGAKRGTDAAARRSGRAR